MLNLLFSHPPFCPTLQVDGRNVTPSYYPQCHTAMEYEVINVVHVDKRKAHRWSFAMEKEVIILTMDQLTTKNGAHDGAHE